VTDVDVPVRPLSLAPADILRSAFRLLRRRPVRVLGTGFLVFGIGTILEIPVVALFDVLDETHPLLVAVQVVASGFSVFGLTFYAGVIDHTVAEYERGEVRRSLPEILRRLPYSRLIVADLLLTLGAAFFLLLLVVPGFAFYTMFVFVGPIIIMEDRSVLGAFGRARRISRHHLWLVLCMVTLPVFVEESIFHGIEISTDSSILVSTLFNVVLSALVVSIVGVVEVTIANRLAQLHPE
jgi:hypothetical protein